MCNRWIYNVNSFTSRLQTILLSKMGLCTLHCVMFIWLLKAQLKSQSRLPIPQFYGSRWGTKNHNVTKASLLTRLYNNGIYNHSEFL